MKADIKQKWIEALRSGEYKQAAEVLRDKDDRYCCLGVLCNLVAPDDWDNEDLGSWDHRRNVLDRGEELPHFSVLEDAYLGYDEATNLAKMNDTGSTFAEIADYIEGNL